MAEYLVSLVPLLLINGLFVLGLNFQYGLCGILNFTYYTFIAIGAYTDALLTLGPPQPSLQITYILGISFPIPLSILAAGAVSAGFGVILSFAALRRLRSDYLAITTVGAGYIIYTLVGNINGLADGWNGLFNIPQLIPSSFDPVSQQLLFSAVCAVVLVITFAYVERVRRSPAGRVLRAIRDDPDVVSAFGRNVFLIRLRVFAIGCFIAGVSGALLVQYSAAWSPSTFLPTETFILWAALIIGGIGNNWGALVGAWVVVVGIGEATRFLPAIGPIGLIASLRGLAIGVLLIVALRFRPQGLIPERPPIDRADGGTPTTSPRGRVLVQRPQVEVGSPQMGGDAP